MNSHHYFNLILTWLSTLQFPNMWLEKKQTSKLHKIKKSTRKLGGIKLKRAAITLVHVGHTWRKIRAARVKWRGEPAIKHISGLCLFGVVKIRGSWTRSIFWWIRAMDLVQGAGSKTQGSTFGTLPSIGDLHDGVIWQQLPESFTFCFLC